MRAIVQRVKSASVEVSGETIGSIEKGLLVFLAVKNEDTDKDLDYIIDKVCGLRIFTDDNDKMNLSVKDVGGQILLVSQFTLYGDVRKGKRPSFTDSAKGDLAERYYEKAIAAFKNEIDVVETGRFGADMQVSLINDGPVTIQLDSSKIY